MSVCSPQLERVRLCFLCVCHRPYKLLTGLARVPHDHERLDILFREVEHGGDAGDEAPSGGKQERVCICAPFGRSNLGAGAASALPARIPAASSRSAWSAAAEGGYDSKCICAGGGRVPPAEVHIHDMIRGSRQKGTDLPYQTG